MRKARKTLPVEPARRQATGREPGSRSARPGADERCVLYADGSCRETLGGWCSLLVYPDGERQFLGGKVTETTNNRMELQAVIEGLKRLKKRPVMVFVDSDYVRLGLTQWLPGWKRRGWRTATGRPVENVDLWRELSQLNHPGVEWQHTIGGKADLLHQECHEVAHAYAQGLEPELD